MMLKRRFKCFDLILANTHLYQSWHLIENAFARLKYFRNITSQFDKLIRNYQSMIYIVCTFI